MCMCLCILILEEKTYILPPHSHSLFSIFLRFSDKKTKERKKRQIETVLNGCIRIYFSISLNVFYFTLVGLNHLARSLVCIHTRTALVWKVCRTTNSKQTIVHLLNGQWKRRIEFSRTQSNFATIRKKKKELCRGQMAFCVLSVLSSFFMPFSVHFIIFILDLSHYYYFCFGLNRFYSSSVFAFISLFCMRIIFIVIAIDIPFIHFDTAQVLDTHIHTPAQCISSAHCCA